MEGYSWPAGEEHRELESERLSQGQLASKRVRTATEVDAAPVFILPKDSCFHGARNP